MITWTETWSDEILLSPLSVKSRKVEKENIPTIFPIRYFSPHVLCIMKNTWNILTKNHFSYIKLSRMLLPSWIHSQNEYTDWERPPRNQLGSRDAALELLSDGHTVAPLIRLGYLHSLRGGKSFFMHFKHRTGERDFPQVSFFEIRFQSMAAHVVTVSKNIKPYK